MLLAAELVKVAEEFGERIEILKVRSRHRLRAAGLTPVAPGGHGRRDAARLAAADPGAAHPGAGGQQPWGRSLTQPQVFIPAAMDKPALRTEGLMSAADITRIINDELLAAA